MLGMEIMNNKPLNQSLLKWILIIVSLAVTLLYAWYFFTRQSDLSPNRDNAKLIEVRKIAQETPVPINAKLTSSSENSFAHAAGISQEYFATIPCTDIKKYYEKVLTERGWELGYENKATPLFSNSDRYILEFRRADFFIGLEYRESKEKKETDCSFILGFRWSDKGFGLNK
jgi:hypothetical protein